MSDKEARVRLTLNSGSFLGGMQQVTTQVTAEGQKMSKALHGPMAAGLQATKAGLVGLTGELRNIAKFGAGLGGSLALYEAAKGATELQSQYKNIAFAIRAGTGEALKWQDVQSRVEATALQWGQKNQEVADSFRHIYDETGSLKFTEQSIGAVAKASMGTGKSVEAFAQIAGTAFEKFGIDAAGLDHALMTTYSLVERGGITFEELGQALDMLGASAKQLGMSGEAGISRMLGMAATADDTLGRMREKLTAVQTLYEDMASPEKAKSLGKALHVNLLDKKGNVKTDALETIIAKTGGDPQKILAAGFSGPTAKLLTGLGEMFKQGVEGSDSKTKSGKIKDGLDSLHSTLENAAKSNMELAVWNQQALEKSKGFKAAINTTMNELQDAFSKPEMVDAMKKLAHLMPQLAQAVAKMLEVVANHPLLSLAGFAGGKIGLELGKNIAASMASGLGKKIAAEIMAQKVALTVTPILDNMGMKIGEQIAQSATAATPWNNAGKLLGAAAIVGIAAYLAYKLGEAAINANDKSKKDIQNAAAIGVAVSGTRDRKQIKPALAKARSALAAAKARDESDEMSMAGGAGGMGFGGMIPHKRAGGSQETKAAQESVNELEKALRDLTRSSKDASDELNKVKTAATAASNGLPKKGVNDPG
jgi:hypothetical protein